MRYQAFGERFIVRLESGESVMDALKEFLDSEDVGFGNLSAAGALSWVRLAFWNPETRRYELREFEEQMEVVSFQGNASRKNGKPHLHLHGVFGRRDFSVVGGHIEDARVHPTLEVWLRTEEIEVERSRDEASGLDLLDLPLRGEHDRAA